MNGPQVPEQQDFEDYAEGLPLRSQELQRQILQILAVSPELRQQIAQLKKDIYLVNSQIPEFEADPDFAQELRSLAETWLNLSLRRRLAFKEFLSAKEFFAVVTLFILAALVLVFLLLTARA